MSIGDLSNVGTLTSCADVVADVFKVDCPCAFDTNAKSKSPIAKDVFFI